MGSLRTLVVLCAMAVLRETPAAAQLQAEEHAAAENPATGAIRVYQRHLSAMRHMRCRFSPSCSQYAIEALAAYGVVEGSARAADRLMRCNASSENRYPRNSEGLLLDPVAGQAPGLISVQVPAWLLPPAAGDELPVSRQASADRRARLLEARAFATLLEQRGDCERASTEYQRFGALADTLPAHAWAYAHVGHCYFDASQWYFADRAFLTSAMLTTDPAGRANVGYLAAASRFGAGAYVACERLLADSALLDSPRAPAGLPPPADSVGWPIPERAVSAAVRVATLNGLCAFALGDWSLAEDAFGRAVREGEGTPARERLAQLARFVGRGRELPRRSVEWAGALSTVLPGAGQAYSGQVLDGVRHLAFNAALIYTVAALADDGHGPASVLVGTVALPFYLGNVLGARDTARRFNQRQRMRLLERAIEDSSR